MELMESLGSIGASGTYDLAIILSEMLLRTGVSIHIQGAAGGGGVAGSSGGAAGASDEAGSARNSGG